MRKLVLILAVGLMTMGLQAQEEAKEKKDYKLVQTLQQQLDTLRKLEDKPDMEDFPKDGTKNNNS